MEEVLILFPHRINDFDFHPYLQHYDAEHRMIKCPECDREFKTQVGMDQVLDSSHGQRSTANGYLAL